MRVLRLPVRLKYKKNEREKIFGHTCLNWLNGAASPKVATYGGAYLATAELGADPNTHLCSSVLDEMAIRAVRFTRPPESGVAA